MWMRVWSRKKTRALWSNNCQNNSINKQDFIMCTWMWPYCFSYLGDIINSRYYFYHVCKYQCVCILVHKHDGNWGMGVCIVVFILSSSIHMFPGPATGFYLKNSRVSLANYWYIFQKGGMHNANVKPNSHAYLMIHHTRLLNMYKK